MPNRPGPRHDGGPSSTCAPTVKNPRPFVALVAAALLAACAAPAPAPLDAARFEALFPQRLPFYSLAGFEAARRAFPAFANSGDARRDRQELAAFLSQIDHESDGLRALREYDISRHAHYCREQLPGERCAPGRQYYGRGPIQLSWNYQYRAAGAALGLDLWARPDLVAEDERIAWQTALWYWMTQPGPGTLSAHAALAAGLGFGATTRSINGALECGQAPDSLGARQMQARAGRYRELSALLGVAPQEPLTC